MSLKFVFFTNFRRQQPSLSSEMFSNEFTVTGVYKTLKIT